MATSTQERMDWSMVWEHSMGPCVPCPLFSFICMYLSLSILTPCSWVAAFRGWVAPRAFWLCVYVCGFATHLSCTMAAFAPTLSPPPPRFQETRPPTVPDVRYSSVRYMIAVWAPRCSARGL